MARGPAAYIAAALGRWTFRGIRLAFGRWEAGVQWLDGGVPKDCGFLGARRLGCFVVMPSWSVATFAVIFGVICLVFGS